jgi:hypothetical protein
MHIIGGDINTVIDGRGAIEKLHIGQKNTVCVEESTCTVVYRIPEIGGPHIDKHSPQLRHFHSRMGMPHLETRMKLDYHGRCNNCILAPITWASALARMHFALSTSQTTSENTAHLMLTNSSDVRSTRADLSHPHPRSG